MVRKTTRAAALKASEKTKRESPRRSRRKRSLSKSCSSEDEVLSNLLAKSTDNNSSGNESDVDSKKPLKKRTRTMTTRSAKKQLQNRSSSVAASTVTAAAAAADPPNTTKSRSKAKKDISNEFNKDEEVKEETVVKGKSETIDHKLDAEGVSVETDNENVQMIDQSTVVNQDDQSKNGTEIDVNISESILEEMSCGNSSAEVTHQSVQETASTTTTTIIEASEEVVVPEPIAEDDAKIQHQEDEEVAESIEEADVESTIVPEEQPSSSSDEVIEIPTENVESPTTLAVETKKKITLKRLEIKLPILESEDLKEKVKEEKEVLIADKTELEAKIVEVEAKSEVESKVEIEDKTQNGEEWGSTYESNNDDDSDKKDEPVEKVVDEKPSATKKKITLKRPTLDDLADKKESVVLEADKSVLVLNQETEKKISDEDHTVKRWSRQSSGADRSISESDDKPSPKLKKLLKPIKLRRSLYEEEPESAEKKFKLWSHRDVSNLLVEHVYMDTLKEICSKIEFLNEEDVNLEIIEKKSKRMTFKELEDEEMENIEAELNAEPEESAEIKENIIAINRTISIVDDTASKLNPPPSPAKNPVSEVLFITNLVRPFTVKQLTELLERTGKIQQEGFWTDRIKSKCYVCYETIEEAEATRNALHGIHWPIGNGKKLQIDFGTMEDLEIAKNPPVVVPPVKEPTPEKENLKPDMLEEQQLKDHHQDISRTSKREWDVGKEERHKRSRSREYSERKQSSRRSLTPEVSRKKHKHNEEQPAQQKAMDDLFLKTKATPSIYWQPLTPDEIAQKQQLRQARLEENKRRLDEIRSTRIGRDRNYRRR